MKNGIKKAFSLVEIMVALALILIFMCLSSEIKINIFSKNSVSNVEEILHKAQQIALQKQEFVFITQENGNFFVEDRYGNLIFEQKLGFEADFYNDFKGSVCTKVTIFPSGFSSRYRIKLEDGKQIMVNPLSLNVYETK